MGALMVIFSLQPKQRAKTKGNHLWLIFHSLVVQQIACKRVKGFFLLLCRRVKLHVALITCQKILLEVTLRCWLDVVVAAAAAHEIKHVFIRQLSLSAGAPLTFHPPHSLSISQLTHAETWWHRTSARLTLALYFCPAAPFAACCCHRMTRAVCHRCQTTTTNRFLSDGQIYARRDSKDGPWR